MTENTHKLHSYSAAGILNTCSLKKSVVCHRYRLSRSQRAGVFFVVLHYRAFVVGCMEALRDILGVLVLLDNLEMEACMAVVQMLVVR